MRGGKCRRFRSIWGWPFFSDGDPMVAMLDYILFLIQVLEHSQLTWYISPPLSLDPSGCVEVIDSIRLHVSCGSSSLHFLPVSFNFVIFSITVLRHYFQSRDMERLYNLMSLSIDFMQNIIHSF